MDASAWYFYYTICFFIFMYSSFYISVKLVSVLLRPTTSLLWGITSEPMCIDVTMCMLMLLFHDSCAMLALHVSIKYLLTYYIYIYIYVCVCVCVCVIRYNFILPLVVLDASDGNDFSPSRSKQNSHHFVEDISRSLLPNEIFTFWFIFHWSFRGWRFQALRP